MKEISLTGSLLFLLLNCVNSSMSLRFLGLFLYICYTILKDLFASIILYYIILNRLLFVVYELFN